MTELLHEEVIDLVDDLEEWLEKFEKVLSELDVLFDYLRKVVE